LLYTASFSQSAALDLGLTYGRIDALVYEYTARVCVVEKDALYMHFLDLV